MWQCGGAQLRRMSCTMATDLLLVSAQPAANKQLHTLAHDTKKCQRIRCSVYMRDAQSLQRAHMDLSQRCVTSIVPIGLIACSALEARMHACSAAQSTSVWPCEREPFALHI